VIRYYQNLHGFGAGVMPINYGRINVKQNSRTRVSTSVYQLWKITCTRKETNNNASEISVLHFFLLNVYANVDARAAAKENMYLSFFLLTPGAATFGKNRDYVGSVLLGLEDVRVFSRSKGNILHSATTCLVFSVFS
jgi:hypothetical protein